MHVYGKLDVGMVWRNLSIRCHPCLYISFWAFLHPHLLFKFYKLYTCVYKKLGPKPLMYNYSYVRAVPVIMLYIDGVNVIGIRLHINHMTMVDVMANALIIVHSVVYFL